METDPLGLKPTPSSSPSQQKLSVELSSPSSTMAVRPAGADGDPEAGAGGGTAAGAAAGGVAGGAPPFAPAKGGRTQRRPALATTDVNKLKAKFTNKEGQLRG